LRGKKDSGNRSRQNPSPQKKPGEENSFFPRVEVVDWNYEKAS
jgi:hypothetical protein